MAALAIAIYTARSAIEDIVGNPTVTLLLLIVIVVLLGRLAEFFIKELVLRARWLRRIIMGAQFIEGTWIDKVVTDNNIESIALLTIVFENSRFEINGESLDLAGERLGTFRTYISEYENWELRYAYHGMNKRKQDVRIDGYGEYHFVRGDQMPLTFSGFLHDSRHMKQVLVQVEKVYHSELLQAVRTREGKKRIIELFLSDRLLQWQFKNDKIAQHL